jgi:hypothetical protein
MGGVRKCDPRSCLRTSDADKQARYEAELVERYGEEAVPHIEESKRRISKWNKADADQAKLVLARALTSLAEVAAGQPIDARVQEIVHRHTVTGSASSGRRTGSPTRASVSGVDAPDFRVQFDAVRPQLAEYLRDA